MPLMNYDDYQKNRHPTPYTFTIKSGSSFLYYFGERHSFKPHDEQWQNLKIFWSDFLKNTCNQKRIAFIEGGKRPVEKDEKSSILKHGGMGLVTYLSSIENIERHSPEPNEKYERTELEKEFSREKIQYYYFARVVLQWCRKENPKPNFSEYIQGYLDGDKKGSGWTDFNFSLDSMKKIHEDIFTTEFNENDVDFFYKVSNPVELSTDINKVSRACSQIRDEYIVKEIQKYVLNGYSIFVEYGSSHAVIQEPLLRELVTK